MSRYVMFWLQHTFYAPGAGNCFHFVCPDLCPVPRTLSVQASPFLSQPGLFRRAGESIPVQEWNSAQGGQAT